MSSRAENRSPRHTGPRWWPAIAIGALLVAWLVWGWFVADTPDRQSRVLWSLGGALLAGLAGSVWLLLFSRLRWRTRLATLAAGGLFALLAAGLFEIRGVSGDVVPVIDWRWSARFATADGASSGLPAEPVVAPDGAADFPQFLGPTRDGRLTGPRLKRDWDAHPPRERWRRAIGAGWSGFAVADGIAVTQEQREDGEYVAAYALDDGRPLWAHVDPGGHDDPLGGPGPRATPAIAEGTVFSFGGTGRLNAIELNTGRRLWTRDVYADTGSELPMYGVSASPLVLDDLVLVAPGGAGSGLVAYGVADGSPRWSAGDGVSGYSSPVRFQLAGQAQVLVFNDAGLWSHRPADGVVLWSKGWPAETQKTSQPVLVGNDRLFLSSGYGVGGTLFSVSARGDGGFDVDELWSSRALKAKFTNVVEHDGFLYGLDDGILACVDLADGRRRWKGGRYGHGQLLLVDDLLLVIGEHGELALVEADPEGYAEAGRIQALGGKTWNHHALAGRHVLVRNDREAACYELPTATAHDAARNHDDGT